MSRTDDRDEAFMAAALSLARRGLGNTAPNPAVGCILVKNGHVLARGWTQPGGRPHAEAMALAQAGDAARGAVAYVTLEPCAHTGQTPPCAQSLIEHGVKRVVAATTDPDARVAGRGLQMLRDGGIDVVEGILEREAQQVNRGFILTKTENRPLFTLKLATDDRGRIPGPDAVGEDKWVTSPAARLRGHLLRAQHDAVLFGIGTVEIDDPSYTCRLPGMASMSPVRVLLDSHLRLRADSNLMKSMNNAPLWVVCGVEAPVRRDLEDAGVEILRAPDVRPQVSWIANTLAARGITRTLIESGPRVVDAVLDAGLVDEIAWFRAPGELGPGSVPAFHADLLEKLAFERQAVLKAGPDQLELYIRKA